LIGMIVTCVAIVIFHNYFSLGWAEIPIVTAIILLYALLPDIDHKMSSITWVFLISGCLLFWLGYFHTKLPVISQYLPNDTTYFGGAIMTLAIFSALLLPHRGPTHTLWFVILSPLLILLVPNLNAPVIPLMIIAALACYTHLIADGYLFKLSLAPKEGRW